LKTIEEIKTMYAKLATALSEPALLVALLGTTSARPAAERPVPSVDSVGTSARSEGPFFVAFSYEAEGAA
jgi:hypothetical protein